MTHLSLGLLVGAGMFLAVLGIACALEIIE
jgi:hypothetical protein